MGFPATTTFLFEEDAMTAAIDMWRRRSERVAAEAADEMRRRLDSGLTPADLGYSDMTASELVESERQAWLEEELRRAPTR